MPRLIRTILVSLLLAIGLAAPLLSQLNVPAAHAQDYGLNQTYRAATNTNPPADTSIAKAMGSALNWMFGILGFIFLMLIVWAGIGWMTAGGNEEKVKKSKVMIEAAIGGLVVVFISFALADAIATVLAGVTGT